MKRKLELKIEDKENNVYYQMNPRYFDEILYLVQNHPLNYSQMIQRKGTRRFPNRNREYLMQWLYDSLPLLRDPFYSVPTKVYWIFHNLIDFPKCMYCNSNLKLAITKDDCHSDLRQH